MIADKGKVGFAKTGSGFGELSLIQNQPRAATVRGAPTRARSGSLSRTHRLTSLSGDGRQVQATSAAVAWSLDRRTFRHYLGSSSTKKMEETMADLKSVEVLKDLTNDHLRKLATAVQTETYTPGQVIIKKGEIGDKFYIIKSGEVICSEIVGREGEKMNDVPLSAGSHFGEMAIIRREPRAATVMAQTVCTVMVVTADDFNSLLGSLNELMDRQFVLRVLQSIPALGKRIFTPRLLQMLVDSMKQTSHAAGDQVVAEGAPNDSFYIVGSGSLTAKGAGGALFGGKQEIQLAAGQFLCEQGLDAIAGKLDGDTGAIQLCLPDGDAAVTFPSPFTASAKDSVKLWRITFSSVEKALQQLSVEQHQAKLADFAPKFEELQIHQTLGTGTFGRVKLVTFTSNEGTQEVAALKTLKKQSMAEQDQLSAIISEREILGKARDTVDLDAARALRRPSSCADPPPVPAQVVHDVPRSEPVLLPARARPGRRAVLAPRRAARGLGRGPRGRVPRRVRVRGDRLHALARHPLPGH